MNCPICEGDSRVIETRHDTLSDGDCAVRRRRECLSCARRFTTWESYERPDLDAERKLAAAVRVLTEK